MGQILNHLLGVFCFTSSGLAPESDRQVETLVGNTAHNYCRQIPSHPPATSDLFKINTELKQRDPRHRSKHGAGRGGVLEENNGEKGDRVKNRKRKRPKKRRLVKKCKKKLVAGQRQDESGRKTE